MIAAEQAHYMRGLMVGDDLWNIGKRANNEHRKYRPLDFNTTSAAGMLSRWHPSPHRGRGRTGNVQAVSARTLAQLPELCDKALPRLFSRQGLQDQGALPETGQAAGAAEKCRSLVLIEPGKLSCLQIG